MRERRGMGGDWQGVSELARVGYWHANEWMDSSDKCVLVFMLFSSRRRHTRLQGDWSSDVCSSDLVSSAVFSPSNLHSRVKSTVRIGTLMPTPSVSVPQIILSNPFCANCSTSTRYFGSRPA